MDPKSGLSYFENVRQPISKCCWYRDNRKFLSPGDPNINNPLGFIIRSALPIGKKLFGTMRLSDIRGNNNANGFILLSLRLMDSGGSYLRAISCHEKLLPFGAGSVREVLAFRGTGPIGKFQTQHFPTQGRNPGCAGLIAIKAVTRDAANQFERATTKPS